MRLGKGVGGFTTVLQAAGELQKFADFINPETQLTGVEDEFEAAQRLRAVEAAAAIRPPQRIDGPDPLVVADCLHIDGSQYAQCSQLADPDRGHEIAI